MRWIISNDTRTLRIVWADIYAWVGRHLWQFGFPIESRGCRSYANITVLPKLADLILWLTWIRRVSDAKPYAIWMKDSLSHEFGPHEVLASIIDNDVYLTLQGTASAKKSGDNDRDIQNAHALGNALVLCMAVPWSLCGIFYTGLAPRACNKVEPRSIVLCAMLRFLRGHWSADRGFAGGMTSVLWDDRPIVWVCNIWMELPLQVCTILTLRIGTGLLVKLQHRRRHCRGMTRWHLQRRPEMSSNLYWVMVLGLHLTLRLRLFNMRILFQSEHVVCSLTLWLGSVHHFLSNQIRY